MQWAINWENGIDKNFTHVRKRHPRNSYLMRYKRIRRERRGRKTGRWDSRAYDRSASRLTTESLAPLRRNTVRFRDATEWALATQVGITFVGPCTLQTLNLSISYIKPHEWTLQWSTRRTHTWISISSEVGEGWHEWAT